MIARTLCIHGKTIFGIPAVFKSFFQFTSVMTVDSSYSVFRQITRYIALEVCGREHMMDRPADKMIGKKTKWTELQEQNNDPRKYT